MLVVFLFRFVFVCVVCCDGFAFSCFGVYRVPLLLLLRLFVFGYMVCCVASM